MSMVRVCYLGAYDPIYPRNLILRRGLAQQGAEVVPCNVPIQLNTRERLLALARAFPPVSDQCDLILLAEFNQMLAPLAWWLARRYRKKLVVDLFTSLYDSAVHDRAQHAPASPKAMHYGLADWLGLHLPDRVIADTEQHRDYFIKAFGAHPAKVKVVPVGASQEWFSLPPAKPHGSDLLILFYGSHIPLHGIDIILRAASRLRTWADLRFELIGRGQTYTDMRTLAEGLDLPNVRFRDHVPMAELPHLVAQADICLGIFGTTPKAGRVVPNKVYQSLALGKPVITADTPAIREHFSPGEHFLGTAPGNDEELAEAIIALADEPIRRAKLADSGRARMEESFTEQALGHDLLKILQCI